MYNEENVTLCGSSAYEKKYYFNETFDNLPSSIKDELKIMCVLYVHDVGGILTLVYDGEGELQFEVMAEEFDPMFDDIGSRLLILLLFGYICLFICNRILTRYSLCR